MVKRKKVFVVALEASGDALAGRVMDALRRNGTAIEWCGVGGEKMLKAGLARSLFDMREGSVMGTTEILPSLFRLFLRMRYISKVVLEERPDLILTVDSKGFNFRFLSRVRQLWKRECPHLMPPPAVHLVSPSVWALRRNWISVARRNQQQRDHEAEEFGDLSQLVDETLALLPFEPSFMASSCSFVGHPVLEEVPSIRRQLWFPGKNEALETIFSSAESVTCKQPIPPARFVACHPLPDWAVFNINPRPETKQLEGRIVIGFFPGSRSSEVSHALTLLQDIVQGLSANEPCQRYCVVVSKTSVTSQQIEAWESTSWVQRSPIEVRSTASKEDLFAQTHMALAVSGTVVTELSLRGIPTAVFYKGSWLTSILAKRLAKVRFVTLCNILADKPLVPEFIFEACTPESLVKFVKSHREDMETRRQIMTTHSYLCDWDIHARRPIAPSALIARRLHRYLDKEE